MFDFSFANFTNLSFLQPFILLAFITLPLLWVLLRITPPPPKVVRLPTYHFIKDLVPTDHTSKDTPLWLLLLRLLAASLLIAGFAGPILNAEKLIPGTLPVRIVIDNSWAGAANWSDIQSKAIRVAQEAGEDGKDIQIVLLADDPIHQSISQNILSAKESVSTIKALEPQGWGVNTERLEKMFDANAATQRQTIDKAANDASSQTSQKPSQISADTSFQSILLSSGIAFENLSEISNNLVQNGGFNIFTPQNSKLPYILQHTDKKDISASNEGGLHATLKAMSSSQTNRPLTVSAINNKNMVIDLVNIAPKDWTKDNDTFEAKVHFDLPPEIAGKIQRLQLRDQKTAATTLIVDPSLARKNISIVQIEGDKDQKAFIGASYYLQRALEPFADITQDTIGNILEQAPPVIIMPDDIPMFPEDLNKLKEWLHKGGVLIRFAGPRLLDAAQSTSGNLSEYLPVRLRRGGRNMGGDLSWEDAQTMKPFDENGLFYGLSVSEDIKIKSMVLAEPEPSLDAKIWARLQDDTPLITFDNRENGLVVLIHTASTADWSSLPLSGLYVNILKRLVDLSSMPQKPSAMNSASKAFARLSPIYTLDAFGNIQSPSKMVKPVRYTLLPSQIEFSAQTQAGLYAGQGLTKTLNLSDSLTLIDDGTTAQILAPIASADVPFSVSFSPYQSSDEYRPGSFILYLALLILLVDLIAYFFLMGGLKNSRSPRKVSLMIFAFSAFFAVCSAPNIVFAQDSSERADYANDFYLAYIVTGDKAIDEQSAIGLEELAISLTRRTSAEPKGVKDINLLHDELSFFPLIYWPVTSSQGRLPASVIEKLQDYIDHGGMILFDLQNARSLITGQSNQTLKRLIGPLTIAPLELIPNNHALGRSFYLLNEYPGALQDNALWVEQKGNDRISDAGSVIIGSNRWAESWARGPVSRRDEMAMRTGINFVMYALTGNYKTDQVHVNEILERLGE